MKYVFFGTPQFAAIVLEKLLRAGFVPQALICNPDRPVGRKKILTPPATKQLIANGKWQIEVFQPSDLSAISHKLKAMMPDAFIVTAYAKILPKDLLQIPRLGAIGIHPSLLPRHRGATPIQTAILEGDLETGVTLYQLDEKMDHGPTLASSKLQISNSKFTYIELEKKLAEMGGELLVETLPWFIRGEIKPQQQDESRATYTKKFTAEDGHIEEALLKEAESGKNQEAALRIARKIRALNPEPGVWTYANALANGRTRIDGKYANALAKRRTRMEDKKRVKLLEAAVENGRLILTKIQREGEKPRQV